MPKFSEQKREMVEEAIRQKVLEVASEILRLEGWSGFTMDKLASQIGVSKGTVYNYFKDKRDVVLFIQERLADQEACEIERMMERESDSRKVLRGLICRFMRGIKDRRYLHVAACEMFVSARAEERSRILQKDSMSRVQQAFRGLITRGIQQGEFRSSSPELMESLVRSTLTGLDMTAQFCPDLDIASPEVIAEVTEYILQGICNGGSEKNECH